VPGTKKFLGDEIPVAHITAPPITPLIGAEQIIISFIIYNYRISCSPMSTPSRKVRNGRIAIIKVNGITIGFLLSICLNVYKCKKENKA
jgi:hypothetical protein